MLPVTELMNIPDHTFVKSTQSSATQNKARFIAQFLAWFVVFCVDFSQFSYKPLPVSLPCFGRQGEPLAVNK